MTQIENSHLVNTKEQFENPPIWSNLNPKSVTQKQGLTGNALSNLKQVQDQVLLKTRFNFAVIAECAYGVKGVHFLSDS